MVTVENISKSFGEHCVLHDVSFALESGEFVGLVGPSGSGKSVLLKILGGVLPPESGRIYWEGQNAPPEERFADATESNKCAARVGFLFQEGALFDSMNVLENVMFPLTEKRDRQVEQKLSTTIQYGEAAERAYQILREVGLGEAIYKMPGQLSGGMRRRVGIARSLVNHPELVLMDDPTGGLDPVAASVIIDLVKRLHALYRPTVLLVSHDIRRLLPSVERVIALFEGNVVSDVAPGQLTSKAPGYVVDFLKTRFDFSTFPAHSQ